MALPVVRTKLKTASSKNQGLQDILKSCSRGMEILSVEKHVGRIHNTKITLEVDLGADYPATYGKATVTDKDGNIIEL